MQFFVKALVFRPNIYRDHPHKPQNGHTLGGQPTLLGEGSEKHKISFFHNYNKS